MKIILLLSLLSSGTLEKVITESGLLKRPPSSHRHPGVLRRSRKPRRSLASFKPLTINRFSELLRRGRRRFSAIDKRVRRGGRAGGASPSRRKLGPSGSQLGTLAGATGAYLAFGGDKAAEIAELRKLLQRQWFKLTLAKRQKRSLLARVGTLLKRTEGGVAQLEEGLDRKIDSINVVVPMETQAEDLRNNLQYLHGNFKFSDAEPEYQKLDNFGKNSEFYDEAREFLEFSQKHKLKN